MFRQKQKINAGWLHAFCLISCHCRTDLWLQVSNPFLYSDPNYFYDQGLCFTNISLLLFVASSVLHWKCGRAKSTQRWAGDNDQSMYQTSYLTVLNCVTRVGMLWHFIFITLANSSAPHNIHPAPHHHHLPTADVRSHWHWLLKEKGRSRLVPSLRQKKERKMQSKQQQQQKGEKLTVFQSIFQGQAVWR